MKNLLMSSALLLASVPLHLWAGIESGQTELKRAGREIEVVDAALFLESKGQYKIVMGTVYVTVPAAQVEFIKPPAPKDLETCKSVARLERIVDDYHRLWWDVEAATRLLPLYIDQGKPDKTVRLYESIKPFTAQDVPVLLHRYYWKALRLTGSKLKLAQALDKAIAGKSRELAAWAYVVRGNLLASQHRSQDALLDGYFRAIILYRDMKSCRKEALQGAIAVLDRLHDPRADMLREMLKQESLAE